MSQGEQQQQQCDCMMKVNDIVEAGDGLGLKVQPAEVRHNVHDKHVGHLQSLTRSASWDV